MGEQTFGPRRCRDSRKPQLEQCVQVIFYRCESCGDFFHQCGFDLQEKQLTCCGEAVRRLDGISLEAAQAQCPQVKLDYQIVGGYNDNAVQVTWNRLKPEFRPAWIYLKTFTGGYQKYVLPDKRAPLVFALADTDAFAYCDADPCLECTFRCKRGFELYAFIGAVGLIQIPLDKMSPYWESR